MSVEAATLEGAFLGMIEETDGEPAEDEAGSAAASPAGLPGGDGGIS
jgi:hypothetical protein